MSLALRGLPGIKWEKYKQRSMYAQETDVNSVEIAVQTPSGQLEWEKMSFPDGKGKRGQG